MWRVVLWVSAVCLVACGKTQRNDLDVAADSAGSGGASGPAGGSPNTGGAGGRGDGGSALGGTAGRVSSGGAAGARAVSCETEWSGYVGCSSTYVCQEPESAFAESALGAVCLPELGATPVNGPCWTYSDFVGRCYDPSNESWTYYYNDAEPAGDCADPGQVYCENPHGVAPSLVETCRTTCVETEPDYAEIPECADAGNGSYCVVDCWEAVSGLAPACAECVVASISWTDGYCVDFECMCPAPQFVPSSAPECAASCQ